MDSKAPATSLCLFKETRLDLEPYYPNSVIHIQLPSTTTFNRTTPTQCSILNNLPFSKDEESFKKNSIATSGSLYCCESTKYPRNYLWRCLEHDSVLELRSADLIKGEHETREATLVLRLAFSTAIRQGGIALAAAAGQGDLSVFVLTTTNDLYTFTLRPEHFCQPGTSDGAFERCFKVFKPASLTISAPHRLFACSSREVVVALGDGRLMRLTRNEGEDGSLWQERTFGDGPWGSSLRGLIRWQGNNAVRYGSDFLDQGTAVAVASSPDDEHLYAVCLNHTLKVWNKKSGKLSFSRDLQDKQRDPQDISRIMLSPSAAGMLQILETKSAREGDKYYTVTFSPHDSGIFKFWAIRDADHSETGVRDLYPEITFRIPDLDDGAAWTLADFKIKDFGRGQGMKIWVLMRMNRRYVLYSQKFSLFNLPEDWLHEWSTTTFEASERETVIDLPMHVSDLDPQDVNEKWLNFLLSPGRLTETMLETALSIYCQARELPLPGASAASLEARIGTCVGSRVELQHSDGNANLAKFRKNIHDEWIDFWSIASDLDQSRWDPLSLGYDEQTDLPWIIYSGGFSIIRECSQLEFLIHNKSHNLNKNINVLSLPSVEMTGNSVESAPPDELALLIEVAAQFRATFSESLLLSCKTILRTELWQESSYSVPVRIQNFYDRCNFTGEVGDRQYDDLAVALADIDGFGGLDNASFQQILDKLPHAMSTEASGLVSTKFGLKVLVKGAQEMISLRTRILTDLILLVIFVDMEVDREETPMENFEAPEIYMRLLENLRSYQMMQWLSTNVRSEPNISKEVSPGPSSKPKGLSQTRTSTILENLFAVDPQPQSYTNQSQTTALTSNISDLLQWIQGGNDSSLTLDQVLVHIQCNLLKNDNLTLATSFLQFQPSTAWSTYIKGRLHLFRAEFSEATMCFQKAAYKLSRPAYPPISYPMASSNLLTPLSAFFLSTGLQNYYTHILSLFEPFPSYSPTHIITFSRLALLHSSHPSSLPSPPNTPQDPTSDILTRLFTAALACHDYPTAYSALNRYPPSALRTSAVGSLVASMLASASAAQCFAFPWLGDLAPAVDAFLAAKAQAGGESPLQCQNVYSQTEVGGGVEWYKVLYSWRMGRGNVRGAAEALMARMERRQSMSAVTTTNLHLGRVPRGPRAEKKAQEGLLDEYLVLINALAVLGEGDADGEDERAASWVFVVDGNSDEMRGGGQGKGKAMRTAGTPKKRRVVRLEDVRAGYQTELDRRDVLEAGRWGIVGGE